jgi:hypothetical protein
VTAQAAAAREAGDAARAAAVRRLRGELRRIARRDYFPPRARERARAAVEALAPEAQPDAIPGAGHRGGQPPFLRQCGRAGEPHAGAAPGLGHLLGDPLQLLPGPGVSRQRDQAVTQLPGP